MRHPLRAIALALALAATPACASLNIAAPNPVAAAETLDQRAYALISAYAAIVEEAADVVRDPAVPVELKRALGVAERAATPAMETLQIAVAAYVRAQADIGAGEDASALNRLAVVAQHLSDAVVAAESHIAALRALVKRQT